MLVRITVGPQGVQLCADDTSSLPARGRGTLYVTEDHAGFNADGDERIGFPIAGFAGVDVRRSDNRVCLLNGSGSYWGEDGPTEAAVACYDP